MPESPDKKPTTAAKARTAKPLPAKAEAAPATTPAPAKAVAIEPAKSPAVKAGLVKPAAAAKPPVAAPAAAKPATEAPKPATVKPAPPEAAPKPVTAKAPEPVAAEVPEPVAAKAPEPVPAPKSEPVPALDVIVTEPATSPVVVPVEAVSNVEEEEPQPAPIVAAASQKGTSIMNETVKKVEETTQKLFGDIKGRATAAYEKSTKLAEDSVEFHKANFEALVESSKLAAKGAETLGQEAAEYGRKSFESATATMKSFASVKTPTELFKLQSDYAKSSFDSFVAEASKASEAWMKLSNEVFQPISSRISVAVEKVKTATAI